MDSTADIALPKWTSKSFPSCDILAKKRRELLLKRLSSLCRNENDQYVLVHPTSESDRLWNVLKDAGKIHCPQKNSLLGLIRSINIEAFLLETYLDKTYNNLSFREIQTMLNNYVESHPVPYMCTADKKKMLPALVASFEEQLLKIVLQESKRICDAYCERTKLKSEFYCYIEWVLSLGIVPYESHSQQWNDSDTQLLENAIKDIVEKHPHCGNLVKALYETKRSVLSELKTCVIPDFSDCAIVISTTNRLNVKAIRIRDGKMLKCQVVYPLVLDNAFKAKFTSPFSHIVPTRDHTKEVFDLYETALRHNASPYRVLITKKSIDVNTKPRMHTESDDILKDVLDALNSNDTENIKSMKALVKFTLALKSPENQDIVKTMTNVLTGEDFDFCRVKPKGIDGSCISKIVSDADQIERLAANGDFDSEPLLETTKQYNLQYNEHLQREGLSRSAGANWRDDGQSTGALQGKLWTLAQQFMREKTKNGCLKKSISETVKQYVLTKTELETCQAKYKEVLQTVEKKRPHFKSRPKEWEEFIESSLEDEPLFKKRRLAEENAEARCNGSVLNLSKLQEDHETVNQAIISSTVPDIEYSLNRLDRIWSSIISDSLHFISVRTYSNQVISRIPTRQTLEVLVKPFLRLVQLDSVANIDTVMLDDQERLPSDINLRTLNNALYKQQGISSLFNWMKIDLGSKGLVDNLEVKIKRDSRLGENVDNISESIL